MGSLLRRARLAAALEIEQVSLAICVTPHQILSLERGAFHLIPEEVYRKNIIRAYSTYLGLSWGAIETWYEEEVKKFAQATEKACPVGSKKAIGKSHFWDMTSIARYGVLTTAALLIVGYLGWLGYVATRPPELVITTPASNLVSQVETVVVEGYAREAATISINGIAVPRDQEGGFHQAVVLAPGVNIVTVAAAKKYSQPTTVSRQIVWEAQPAPTVSPPTSLASPAETQGIPN